MSVIAIKIDKKDYRTGRIIMIKMTIPNQFIVDVVNIIMSIFIIIPILYFFT